MWVKSSLNWVLEMYSTSYIGLNCQPRGIPSLRAAHPPGGAGAPRLASPVTAAHAGPLFLFPRSPESGDVLLGQLLALVSDLPRGYWWSDEHSARDLYNELPPTPGNATTVRQYNRALQKTSFSYGEM